MTVALSRARLGLYILGRRQVFESCYELREAFELLMRRPDKLTLVTGELWPSERVQADDVDRQIAGEAVMEGVEHLGQYVFEMANTKIEQLQAETGSAGEVPVLESISEDPMEERDGGDDGGDAEADESEAVGAGGFEAEEE